MQSLRRAALRAALSTSRAVVVKPQPTFFAQSASVARACAIPAVRCFSQSSPFLNSSIEDRADSQVIENAIKSADQAVVEDAAVYDESKGETPHGIFCRNIVFDATEELLTEAFSKYGEVTGVAIARDPRGLSKGFAFVWYKNAEAAASAVQEANGSFWHGRRLHVSPRTKSTKKAASHPTQPTNSLYIGNIPYETTDAELNRMFRGLDNVTDIRVAVDRTTGWPRGFAHADFADVESCVKAKEKLAGTAMNGRELRFDFASQAAGFAKRNKPRFSESEDL